MFNKDNQFKAFESKVWLSSPTMHGDELKYMTQAYEKKLDVYCRGKY